MSKTEAQCSHCLLDVPPSQAIREDELTFCCEGCQGVYHILRDGGFGEFYSRRDGWSPGPPPDFAEPEPEVFAGAVKEEGDRVELDVQLTGIRCASCVWLIENYLRRRTGCTDARINYATHRGLISWSKATGPSLRDVLHAIRSIGYVPMPYSRSARNEATARERRDLLLRFGTAGFFSMQLMLFTVALYAGYFKGMDAELRSFFQYVTWALATPVMFYSGYPFIANSIRALRNRTLGMDVLVFLGSFSAYAYSIAMIFTGGEVYFDTSAMIITLILLGRYIEANAKGKAGEAVTALLGLQPTEVRLHDSKKLVPVASVAAGQSIEVMPGAKIPLDGVIVEGQAETDESMLTGESMPIRKQAGDEAFAGTICTNGHLVIRVTRVGDETVLARIVRAVEDAQARRAPIQAVADRVVGWFVPAVVALALCTALYWLHAGSPPRALACSVAVLVVACPCALGLATPLAVLMGTLMASGRGIIIRGGDVLERAAHTDTIIFDKTGTLTKGKPTISEFTDAATLLYAAALEAHSEHSFARAVLKAAKGMTLPAAEGFRSIAGKGIEGTIGGERVLLGTPALMKDNGIEISAALAGDYQRLSAQGKTVSYLARGAGATGIVAVSDEPRAEAREIGDMARARGIATHMVTGDNAAVAGFVAHWAKIERVSAAVTPEGKARIIRELKDGGRRVMMLGDGINDAPALTEATVGVAMGRASDIALQSADAVLMRNDPTAAIELADLSRRSLRVIKQNLFWAFSYNIIAIPLAAAGMLHPIVSALCMAASSLLVVGNSLRLRTPKLG